MKSAFEDVAYSNGLVLKMYFDNASHSSGKAEFINHSKYGSSTFRLKFNFNFSNYQLCEIRTDNDEGVSRLIGTINYSTLVSDLIKIKEVLNSDAFANI